MHHLYHNFVHSLMELIGHFPADETPEWLFPFLHLALFWGPLFLTVALFVVMAKIAYSSWKGSHAKSVRIRPKKVGGLPSRFIRFVMRHSRRDQIALVALGVIAMPPLYLSFELPKIIINEAISSNSFPVSYYGFSFSQNELLALLSSMFLALILINGALKYQTNIYKGRVGERLLRRLRLSIFRTWCRGKVRADRTAVISIIQQEVEPLGGFASDALSLPVTQAGTFVTILTFLFVQDPILGLASLILLPVQLAVIPHLQKRINILVRERLAKLRSLSVNLGKRASRNEPEVPKVTAISGELRELEAIRLKIHKTKFFMKFINNSLTALTPFFFYSVGGYLVIKGSITLGALIAVLAAYKDFSAPLRELFRFYQSCEDVRVRYQGVREYLQPDGVFLTKQRA